MNRNSMTRFSRVPAKVDYPRSSWTDDHSLITSCNAGDLIPIEYQEIVAGDTVSMTVSSLVRSTTPIHPVMDDAYLDTYFFYVPFRLVWSHWKNFMGENTDGPWAPTVTYTPPKVTSPVGTGFAEHSLADYFKMPIKVGGKEVDALRFRAYRLIWNEWFRSEALQSPLLVNDGDNETDPTIYGDVLKANKFHDYFTSALPSPQRGEAAQVPLLGAAPLATGSSYAGPVFRLWNPSGTAGSNYGINMGYSQMASDVSMDLGTGSLLTGYGTTGNSDRYGTMRIYDLYADLSQASSVSINDFRRANAIQLMLEADARSGGRYREILRAHFGVTVPDTTVQVPEYLGGRRVNLRTQEVLQTSASVDNQTPQGNAAAMSKTVDESHLFTKSFTEPGMLIGVACIRTNHTYQQGIPRDAMRRTKYDYYWPALAALGEQPVSSDEIYASGNPTTFGYQEAFAEYRYTPNAVTAEMRSNSARSLDVWHYADYYSARPTLSGEWIAETAVNFDRTLAISSDLSDQFKLNFFFDIKWTRPMPLYSVPGLSAKF